MNICIRQTSCSRRPLKFTAVVILAGTTASLIVAAFGPSLLPPPSGVYITNDGQAMRFRSWLATESYLYGMNYEFDAAAALHSLGANQSADDVLRFLLYDTLITGRCRFDLLETGFPARSLRAWQFEGVSPSISVGDLEPKGAFTMGGPPSDTHLTCIWIPYLPIWHGIALNALAWSGLCWLCMTTAAMTRSSYRRRRGLCPHCRYDLRTIPPTSPCPECGHTRPPRVQPS